ncbi:hypothetical protein QFZ79_002947 [Arthrobacter sp. V4I6]|uniref:hypothetical protein n=1 Tax=Arthrobacter sp. V4I6 TaxID=3042281 RepID=UPI002781F059|nr:hypothetical protein [Arthrobacter sp. V4I6]MDQ0854836.1 hypothetical protein [Arthrobacter sp. V4I6]
MSEGTAQRRATRRNLASQPIPGSRVKPATVKPSPISPAELAQIIAEARTERTETDIANYAARKAS